MARSSQYWLVVLIVLVAAAAAAFVVNAESAAPTLTDKVTEKVEQGKEATKIQATQVKGAVNAWKDWARKRTGEWTAKGKESAGGASGNAQDYVSKTAETLQTSTVQTHESVAGAFSKWSTWAKETAGKYNPVGKPHRNPASEAVKYINKHKPGSTDSVEDEL